MYVLIYRRANDNLAFLQVLEEIKEKESKR